MSVFGWSYPAGCSGTPYDEEPPEDCPQCGADNSDEDGKPVCADAPDFCSVACQEMYLAAEAEYERELDAMLDKATAAERAAVVAYLREQREYGTDALLGQGFANVCNILSNEIERGEHRREETE